ACGSRTGGRVTRSWSRTRRGTRRPWWRRASTASRRCSRTAPPGSRSGATGRRTTCGSGSVRGVTDAPPSRGRPRAYPRPRPVGAPGGSQTPPTSKQEPCSRAGELLDAAVARIRDVDVPAPVGRHAVGGGELSVARAVAPPGGEEGTARVELLDAVVDRMRDV